MLKNRIKVTNKRGLHYIVEDGGRLLRFKPWLADAFSFLYEFIMKNFIFPKKLNADISRHFEILRNELQRVHKKRVLELATGTGSAVNFLANDNRYTGSDISPGLLRKAINNFNNAGFQDAEFYVASADRLPFSDKRFDIVLCILSLNFFDDIKKVFTEVIRVAAADAVFICCVPVPERNRLKSTIRGGLYSEQELKKICRESGLGFESIPVENGTLLYFRAFLQ